MSWKRRFDQKIFFLIYRYLSEKSYNYAQKFIDTGVLQLMLLCFKKYRPVGQAVTCSTLEREFWDSNLGPVKSDTELPTARHRCYISSKGAVLPGRNDAEIDPANSLHASAYYSEHNETFDLVCFKK